jgi:hypothetical protein
MPLDRVLIQALAALLLLAALWQVFRFAMGLRASKLVREEQRRAEESRGRRVVAELPGEDGALVLFLEDAEGFYWGEREARKSAVVGARLMLNGAVVSSFSRSGAPLPEPAIPEEYEGRERWEVVLYLEGGDAAVVSCGSLREGVSREAAGRVFAAVRETES